MFEKSHASIYRAYTFVVRKDGEQIRVRAVGASSNNASAKLRQAGFSGTIYRYTSRTATLDEVLKRDIDAPVIVDGRGKVIQ